MAEHARSTPAPAVDAPSPDRSAAELWRLYLTGRDCLNEVSSKLDDDRFDALGFAVDRVFGSAIAAPILTPEDASARFAMLRDMIENGNEFRAPHIAALEALATWRGPTRAGPPAVDRLTYLARLHERLDRKSSRTRRTASGGAGRASPPSESDCLSTEAALWLDEVRVEAASQPVRSPEGVAFVAALIIRELDRARRAPEPWRRTTAPPLSALPRRSRPTSDGRQLLPLTFKALAGGDWHTRVADLMGGFGPDGRVQLERDAA